MGVKHVRKFPSVTWAGAQVTFNTAAVPRTLEDPVFAVVVFVRNRSQFVLAEIVGRGWCVPGGRVEPGESPADAAHREAIEECGATLERLHRIGEFDWLDFETGCRRMVYAYVGELTSLTPVTPGPETVGAGLFRLNEIPDVYYMWDPLLEAVFAFAAEFELES